MFWHNFKYTFKTLLKNKSLIFWTFAFPLILGTLFFLAFSDIESNEQFHTSSIAVVEGEDKGLSETMVKIFQELEENGEKMFDVKVVSLKDADALLQDKEIIGYVFFEDAPRIKVNTSGIYETVLKSVTETIYENTKMSKVFVEEKLTKEMQKPSYDGDFSKTLQKVELEVEEILNKKDSYVNDESSEHMSYTMIEFYTLIAMTALYGGILGMVSVNKCLANMSLTGKRVSVSPVRKVSILFGSVFASYIIQLIGLFLLFFYTIFLLHVDYGRHIFLVILLSLTGSFAGLSLGIFTATAFRVNENTKTGILLAFTMFGSFLSGMMGITMKYVVDKNIPILNQINPANMITDGFYALYYYDTKTRFFQDFFSLILFSFVCLGCSVYFLRRSKYDSI